MKKLCLLLICTFILSGCSSKTEVFVKNCKQTTKSEDLTVFEDKEVNFNNKDEVTSVIVTRTYKANGEDGGSVISAVKESASSYNNNLLKSKAIKIAETTSTEKKYVIKYYLDVQKMNDEELEIFNLKKNSVKYFNKMRSSNIECK